MSAISSHHRKHNGFTLLELLVAMSVFAIMSVMAYGGLSQVITNNTSAEAELERMQSVQHMMYTLTRDFSQIIQRDIRDEFGTTQPYLVAGNDPDTVVEFTRSGRRNPAQLLRSNLQRVAYQLEDNTLYRLFWSQLDRVQGMEPARNELLDNIEAFDIRYLDSQAEWHTGWPALNTSVSAGVAIPLPVAVEISMTLSDWGKLKRMYKVSR
ncbi:MAG: type II secretion system minor pseudopilin GspJ [Gammaproteobacteria bacterium]